MEVGPARDDERVAARGVLDAAMLEVDDRALRDGTLLVAREDGRVLGALVLEGSEGDRSEPSERSSGDERSEESRDGEASNRASGARFGATGGGREPRGERRPQGAVSGEGRPASREVVAVAVRPKRRAQGVGSALVRAAAARREALYVEFDPEVRPFYESLGFEIECDGGRCRGHYG